MFVGPVFSREALTAPRRTGFYTARVVFVAALLGLTLTAWQILVGSQDLRNPGELARFGAAVFRLLAPLLLTVSVLFSALLAAAAVSQEKDRKTLLLLLLSDLSNSELVLGKLLASMLTVFVVLASTAPFLLMLTLLGGITHGQVGRVLAVTLLSSLAAGSLGSTLALWREKTFQALALTALVIVLWLVGWEVVGSGAFGTSFDFGLASISASDLTTMMSPWRAVGAALEPPLLNATAGEDLLTTGMAGRGMASATLVFWFLISAGSIVVLLNAFAIAMVRVWNPSREARPQSPAEQSDALTHASDKVAASSNPNAPKTDVHRAPGKVRSVWKNPILWREMRTWAYGKKILVIKLGYLAIFALCAAGAVLAANSDNATGSRLIPAAAAPMAPLLVLSVVLVNALSVTSITNERDGKALDLLLATDLTPKELIFGKLGGVIYNAKEMILAPIALCIYLWWTGTLGVENLVFLILGLLVVNFFAAVLGLHSGMMHPNSRHAIGASIGTLLFLFLGVTTCMRLMLELSDSFQYQLAPFLGFMLGGGVALFAALGWRNPSPAMALACGFAPFATFYALTSFLLGSYDFVFLATVVTFGFATAAMLIPALSEFDVVTGRTSAGD